MRKILFAFLLINSCPAFANDTLTRAQVYNFNVGDTFDYREYQYETQGIDWLVYNESVNFTRCAINKIYYSADNDTLFIVRQWLYPLPISYDTLIIDSLQSVEIYIDTCSGSNTQYSIDSTSSYNEPINSVSLNCYGFSYYKRFAQGLGAVESDMIDWSCSLCGDFSYDSLIYYSKAGVSWGTPYYIANNSNVIHYTPIPEECATWINSFYQRITTGNRVPYNGHTYVEMLYSFLNYGGIPTVDSLMGYFRNDTVNRKAYMYNALDTTPYLTYDFTIPAGGGVLGLSIVNVGGQARTSWDIACPHAYIEGLGGEAGLGLTPYFLVDDVQCQCWFVVCASLTCFSVCGQTLYPDSFADCSFPLGITDLQNLYHLRVTPNPIEEYIHISYSGLPTGHQYFFKVYSLLGQQLINSALQPAATTIPCNYLTSGVYLWMIVDDNGIKIGDGKLVKE